MRAQDKDSISAGYQQANDCLHAAAKATALLVTYR
jgi:hypothetical protein